MLMMEKSGILFMISDARVKYMLWIQGKNTFAFQISRFLKTGDKLACSVLKTILNSFD